MHPDDEMEERRLVCEQCGKERLFRRATISHSIHAVLTVCTGGLWLVCWISLLIGRQVQGWTCTVCKHRQRTQGRTPAS